MTDSKDIPKPIEGSQIQKIIFFFGPLLASFHVATYLVGFFSVGAVAKWITEQWFPFTRWVWTELLLRMNQYISLPTFNDVEKDALTTVVFFAPLGIYALFFRKSHPLDKRYKFAAIFIGLFFVCVVGVSLLKVVVGSMFSFRNGLVLQSVIGWGASAGALVIVVFLSYTFHYARIKVHNIRIKNQNEKKNEDKNENDDAVHNYGDRETLPSSIMFNFFLSSTLFLAAYFLILITENLFDIGVVTAVCFITVIGLAAAAIIRTPYRLSWGLGSLIAFLVSGLLFEGVMLLVDFVHRANQG